MPSMDIVVDGIYDVVGYRSILHHVNRPGLGPPGKPVELDVLWELSLVWSEAVDICSRKSIRVL